MVTLKIETKTDSYEDAVILIHEALKLISEGSQAGIIGGKIGECAFDVDVHAAQPLRVPDVCPVCAGKGTVTNTHGVEQFCLPCDGTGQRR